MNRASRAAGFAVCIERGQHDVDLVVGKIYRVVRPWRNDQPSDIRVVDRRGLPVPAGLVRPRPAAVEGQEGPGPRLMSRAQRHGSESACG
jgi:hypothetical protein